MENELGLWTSQTHLYFFFFYCISPGARLWLALAPYLYHPLTVSPLSPTSARTNSTALLMLALSVTLNSSVFSLGEDAAFSSDAPSSVRHAAITLNPLRSSCRATKFPKPLSQPVMKTCFWSKSSTLYESLMFQTTALRAIKMRIHVVTWCDRIT